MRAVDKVRDRLLRATKALDNAGLRYAVIGGNAVATWVGKVDEAAVRFTRDVDILVRRADFAAIQKAFESAGFVYRHVRSIDMFFDGPEAKARDAVHILFAGEKVKANDLVPTPDVDEVEATEASRRILRLDALVQMKLTSFRDKDRTHLRDMLEIGLIDASGIERLPEELKNLIADFELTNLSNDGYLVVGSLRLSYSSYPLEVPRIAGFL